MTTQIKEVLKNASEPQLSALDMFVNVQAENQGKLEATIIQNERDIQAAMRSMKSVAQSLRVSYQQLAERQFMAAMCGIVGNSTHENMQQAAVRHDRDKAEVSRLDTSLPGEPDKVALKAVEDAVNSGDGA